MRKTLRLHRKPLAFLLLTWGLYFVILFSRMLFVRPDGVYAGHPYVWSDWPLHIAMARIFATKSPGEWFAYHPLYAQGKFTYAFLTNLISGLLMRSGFSLTMAFALPSIVFSLLLIVGLYALIYQLFHSKHIAVLAIFLFFLSSGPGFVQVASDMLNSGKLPSLNYFDKTYGGLARYDWNEANGITGMLVPQRAFLLGMTLAVWSLALLLFSTEHFHQQKRRNMLHIALVFAGILAGALPIAHMHSFMVVVVLAGFVCVAHWREWRRLAYFVIPAAVFSSVLYLQFISGGIENAQFMQWYPGWSAGSHLFKWLHMWIAIWGVTLPLTVVGYIALIAKKSSVHRGPTALLFGFGAVFLVANLFLFQPIHWDNAKLFLWAYLGFSVLAAWIFSLMWEKPWYFKLIVLVLFFSLTLTGMYAVVMVQNIQKNAVRILSTQDMELAEEVRLQTQSHDRFLTAPIHNSWVMVWSARPILMGYTAWVLNYGFSYQQTERDVRAIYRGGNKALSLMKVYDIRYVVIGPTELHDLQANESFFAANFPLVFSNDDYRVFDVRNNPNRM